MVDLQIEGLRTEIEAGMTEPDEAAPYEVDEQGAPVDRPIPKSIADALGGG